MTALMASLLLDAAKAMLFHRKANQPRGTPNLPEPQLILALFGGKAAESALAVAKM
jgi:hypothetical protein